MTMTFVTSSSESKKSVQDDDHDKQSVEQEHEMHITGTPQHNIYTDPDWTGPLTSSHPPDATYMEERPNQKQRQESEHSVLSVESMTSTTRKRRLLAQRSSIIPDLDDEDEEPSGIKETSHEPALPVKIYSEPLLGNNYSTLAARNSLSKEPPKSNTLSFEEVFFI